MRLEFFTPPWEVSDSGQANRTRREGKEERGRKNGKWNTRFCLSAKKVGS